MKPSSQNVTPGPNPPQFDALTASTRTVTLQIGGNDIGFTETGRGCWPVVPFAWADVPYLRGVEKALNGMLAEEAADNDAQIVDDYTASIGHDACKSTSTKWVEPLVPTNAAAPFHPNARGEAGVAAAVVASA